MKDSKHGRYYRRPAVTPRRRGSRYWIALDVAGREYHLEPAEALALANRLVDAAEPFTPAEGDQ